MIVGNLVHDLTESREVWDNTTVVFPESLSVLEDGLAKNEDTINICADHGLHIHGVLERKNIEQLPMTPLLVNTLLKLVVENPGIVCTIV
jgi:hypothetical protein